MNIFKNYLEQIKYNLLLRELCGGNYLLFSNPFPDLQHLKFNLKKFDSDKKTILMFFYLGNNIFINKIKSIIGDDIYSWLLKRELIVEDYENEIARLNGCSLIWYSGFYYFADTPYYFNNSLNNMDDVYVGLDSYNLFSLISHKNIKNALDLCSGSGIGSLILSDFSKIVDSAEISDKAIKYQKVNCEINDITNVNIIKTNLFSKIENKKYDLIISNPPFIPVPHELKYYSIAGNGGSNGAIILKNIIHNCQKYLSDEGLAIICGQSLANSNENIIEKYLNNLVDVKYDLFIINSIPLKTLDSGLKTLIFNAYKRKDDFSAIDSLMLSLEKERYTSFETFVIYIEKNKKIIKNKHKLFSSYNGKTYKLSIGFNEFSLYKAPDTYIVKYKNKNILELDDQALEIIKLEKLNFDYLSNKYNSLEILKLFDDLNKVGILKEVPNNEE